MANFRDLIFMYPSLWDPRDANSENFYYNCKIKSELLKKVNESSQPPMTKKDLERKIRAFRRIKHRQRVKINQFICKAYAAPQVFSPAQLAAMELALIHRIGLMSPAMKARILPVLWSYLNAVEDLPDLPPRPNYLQREGVRVYEGVGGPNSPNSHDSDHNSNA